jgi:hypothetical protein
MPLGKRNYKAEYDEYHSRPEQKKNRAARNAARRMMARRHGRSKLNGKDVDHRDGNPRNNASSNLRVTSVTYNRGKK